MAKKGRQSKDFHEIWNVQTDMEVSQEKWDKTFHNRKEPWKCTGRKRPTGCSICERIDKTGLDEESNSFRLGIVGDIHTNIKGLYKLQELALTQMITVGDLSVYPDLKSASIDKKSYEKNKSKIEKIIEDYNDNKLKPFSVPIFSLIGNHDNFIDLKHDIFKKLNITYLKNGTILEIGNMVIATFGGIYSPKKFYWNSSALKEYNKRFYTEKEMNELLFKVENLNKPVDVLITHEAAAGVLPEMKSHVDEGREVLTDLLKTIKPKYYIHGHHHVSYEASYGNTKVIGLGNFKQDKNAYVVFNIVTGERIDY